MHQSGAGQKPSDTKIIQMRWNQCNVYWISYIIVFVHGFIIGGLYL